MNEEMRARAEELDQTNSFLEGVLASLAAGVVVLDADLQVRSWNRNSVELWGLRSEEVVGKPFFGLDFGLPTSALREIVQECVRSGKRAEPLRVEAVNRIGRRIVCTVTCSPLDFHNGGIVLMMEAYQPD
jgi:two-component system CheB/CheR fusion protein